MNKPIASTLCEYCVGYTDSGGFHHAYYCPTLKSKYSRSELHDDVIKLKAERDTLQAKLDIAVEALKWCISFDKDNSVTDIARIALAKLEEK